VDLLREAPADERSLRVRLADVLESNRRTLASEGLDIALPDLRGWAVRDGERLEAVVVSVTSALKRLAE
jgi:hypothetical protein